MMHHPKISIITVVLNDPVGLFKTMKSVATHKGDLTEYIVADGASSDNTLEVVESFPKLVDKLRSEPDRGIYDAMNKAVSIASGDYILFLNAGDQLLVNPEELFEDINYAPVMLYCRANMLNPDGTLSYVKGKKLKSTFRFLKGMPLCHQSILYRRDSILSFDLDFRIIADRVMTYQLLRKYGLSQTIFINKILVNYYEGGFSGQTPESVWHKEENLFYDKVGVSWYKYKKLTNRLYKKFIKKPLGALKMV